MSSPMWLKVWSREYSVQYSEVALRSVSSEVQQLLGGCIASMVMVPEEGGNEAFYCDESEWQAFNDEVEKALAGNESAFKQFKKTFREMGDAYVSESHELSRKAKELRREELGKAYEEWLSSWRDYTAILWAGWMLNERLSARAEALLSEKAGAQKARELSQIVLHPEQKTEIALVYEKLALTKERNPTQARLEEFAREYAWIPCLDVHNKPWTAEGVREAMESVKKAESAQMPGLEKALEAIDFSDQEHFLLQAAHEMAFIKDERDVYRRKGAHASQGLFAEIGERMGQSLGEAAFWTSAEIIGWCSGGGAVAQQVVQERMKGFLLYYEGEALACASGEKAQQQMRGMNLLSKSEEKEEFAKGIVGSKGFAKGVAKIVLSVGDLRKIQQGDVMVAVTTHPDFVPAMQRACAIVTDEGGLTSHAAIVAREFRIPCVVGCKNATKTFKDGELVEVDAEKGVARKL